MSLVFFLKIRLTTGWGGASGTLGPLATSMQCTGKRPLCVSNGSEAAYHEIPNCFEIKVNEIYRKEAN